MKRSYERPILTKQKPLAAITAQVTTPPGFISPFFGGIGTPPEEEPGGGGSGGGG